MGLCVCSLLSTKVRPTISAQRWITKVHYSGVLLLTTMMYMENGEIAKVLLLNLIFTLLQDLLCLYVRLHFTVCMRCATIE